MITKSSRTDSSFGIPAHPPWRLRHNSGRSAQRQILQGLIIILGTASYCRGFFVRPFFVLLDRLCLPDFFLYRSRNRLIVISPVGAGQVFPEITWPDFVRYFDGRNLFRRHNK